MLKRHEINDPQSCLNRSADDEPVFVICARDEVAIFAVREWIDRAAIAGVNRAKLEDAEQVLERFQEWQRTHPTKLPD